MSQSRTVCGEAFSSLEILEDRKLMSASYAIGINMNDNAAATVAKASPILKSLGVQTVRVWASVSDFNSHTMTSGLQRAIDYANQGFNVTLEVNTANGKIPSTSAVTGWFDWATSNTELKNAVDQWEIGNEPDHAQYWQGTLSQYVTTYLEPAYNSLHAAGESVISAGPSWNPQDVQTMIDAGMLSYCDYVGFHPYAKGVSAFKKVVAAINTVVDGRKPIAATEWNVRGFEADHSDWAQAIQDAYPIAKNGFALNYYFAMETQDSLAGPGGILTTSLALNQPFYNAFATFKGVASSTGGTTGGSTASSTGGTISGVLFNDINNDGIYESGTDTITGSRTVFLDTNANGKLDSGEKSTTSASNGSYTFSGLSAGTYNVTRVFPSGYQLSNNSTGYVSTKVAVGQKVTGVNLGTILSSKLSGGTTTTGGSSGGTTTGIGSTPTATGAAVTEFLIVNAATNQVIGSLPAITGNVTINTALLPKTGINIKVVASDAAGSLKITALGKTFTENNLPFSVFGDTWGDYKAWQPTQGASYTISATAYSGTNNTGAKGNTLTATITFA